MKFLSDILAKAGLTVDGVVTLNNTATGQTPAANDNSTKLATTAWVRGFVTPYSLPIASSVTLGGVKIGSGLAIDGTGIVSVTTSGVGAIRALQQITATAGQTVFTVSGGYTPGLIDVFLNGVLLTPTAITSTNGTTFTLADAALVNDLLDIFVYNPIYNGFISTTDQVPEGATNLYYTNARARAAISLTTTGSSGAATYNSSTGVLNIPSYIGGVVSIFGRTGTVVAVSGDYTTALVTEVTNLYYTDARARAAISVTGSGSYDSATGVITVTGGVTSVNTLTGAVTLTTTNIAEGTNLYYTDARVGTYLTTNSYATQTYVGTQIANLVASAPATLDTLNELATALGNDPNFATTVATSIGTKVPQTRTITINGTAYDLSADRSWTIASGVTSFNTRTGAIVPVSGDYTTALVTESGNLYYTDARARLALSFVAGSGGYNSTTGVITIPTNNNQITNGANYITLVSLSSTATGLTYTNTTGVFSLTAGYSIPTDASQTTWDSAYTNRITSLTTTGTSGAATLSGNVLNIPQYQGGVTSFNTRTGAITLTSSDVTTALTYTPVTNARTLTINGDAYDLTADRTWTIGVSPSARTIQTYTATAAQTTFTVTGGYVVGLVDVFINGVRLTSADFTATNGTTVVLTTGTGVNNIVDVIKYTSAFTASSALRQVTYFTATAGQTSFTVSYTPGLVDVYYNGSKLAASEYTASNGTSVVLANAAVVNDALEVISYAYSVGAFTGLSTTRTLTINGITFDLSADRTWTLTTSNISEGSNLYYTDTRARAAISLTTTGSSGASTYTSGVINIPTYTLSGLGGQTELNGTGLVRMAGTTVSYDNATYATQSYVTTAVANLVNSAPSTLDTLNELATALGNDANFATTVTTSIGTKLPLAGGTLTGALSGTSATFTGALTLNTPVGGVAQKIYAYTDGYGVIQYFTNASVAKWQTGIDSSNRYFIYNEATASNNLTLASTGAATFTSTYGNVLFKGTNASTMWTEYYYNTSTLLGYIGGGSGILSGANASDFIIRSEADYVVATGGNSRRLTIASTGAATFSSTVTTSGVIAGDSKFYNSVQLTPSLGGTTEAFMWLGAASRLDFGVGTVGAGNIKMSLSSGGNVLINTTTDAGYKLDVNTSTTGLHVGNQRNSVLALSTFSKTLTGGYATANNYLQIGAGENGVGGTRLIGFGYSITANTNQPAYIGYIETANAGETKGSLIFGTRDVTTDTAPTTRLTIASTGAATFSSSITSTSGNITANGDIVANSGSSTAVYVYNASSIRAKLSMTGNEGDLTLYGSSANAKVYLSAYYNSYFNAGNVGINNTNPDANLVIGNLSSYGKGTINGASGTINRAIINCPYPGASALTLAYYSAAYGLDIWVNGDGTGLAPVYIDQRNAEAIIFRRNTYGTAAETMRLTGGGEVGIGVIPTAGNRFWVKGSSTTSADTTLYLQNSAGTSMLTVKNSNTTHIGTYTSGGDTLNVSTSMNVRGNLTGTEQNLFHVGNTGSGVNDGYMRLFRDGVVKVLIAADNSRGGDTYFNGGGTVIIGATSTAYPANGRLVVFGDESGPNLIISTNGTSGFGAVRFVNANGIVGSVSMYPTSVGYNTSSDYRLKQDLKDFKGLDLISAIKTYNYEWKSDNKRAYGVLAHELQEVLPQAVFGEKDAEEMQGVDYSKLVPVLIKAIQELKTENDLLKDRLDNNNIN